MHLAADDGPVHYVENTLICGLFGLLSSRERQIVALVVRGRSSAAIGELLHLSPKTVDTYRSRLMAKLGTPDLPALVRYAMTHGLIEQD